MDQTLLPSQIHSTETEDQPLLVSHLGSKERALEIFRGMFEESPAYRHYLNQFFRLQHSHSDSHFHSNSNSHTCSSSLFTDFIEENIEAEDLLAEFPFENIPPVDKDQFFAKHRWSELLPQKMRKNIFAIHRSSGSTHARIGSKGFFWPISRQEERESLPLIQRMLTEAFRLQEKRTLVIIGLSLGSWAGGEQFSFLFKNLAFMSNLDLVFFAPGNQHHEILEAIEKFGDDFDQIIIAMCPSAIFYLHKLAEKKKSVLPLKKLTYVVTGETFSEQFRLDLKNYCGQTMADLTMLSIYGSADTGFLGFESLPLIRVRQFLQKNAEAAKALGFAEGPIPNLFHAQIQDTYFENINGELVVTKWQGIPLVRYNLKDRVQFYSWKKTCKLLAQLDPKKKSFWLHFSQLPLTDFISVSGRSSGCIIWGESKIYEETLQEVILRSSLAPLMTGIFAVWMKMESGQQKMHFQIELKEGVKIPDRSLLDLLQKEFSNILSEIHEEFADDYRSIYEPLIYNGLQIFEFHFCATPYLAEHPEMKNTIKRKIRIETGPL